MTDLGLAIRSLRTTPVVSIVAALSLALGIGANTAIFSLVNSLLLRALPVKAPAQLALLTGGAAEAIGKTLTIEKTPYTIVGVTGPDFFGPEVGRAFDVIIPIGTEPLFRGKESWLDARSTWWLTVMARLKPGQTIDAGTAAM